MRKLFTVLAAGVVLWMVSGPLFAHHAGSLYDREKPVTLTGTVTQYLMINPHAQIHFEVKDENGNVSNRLEQEYAEARGHHHGDRRPVQGRPQVPEHL
ncbi:MAG: hypothetical protein HW398_455 [Acidobacteria bacterium]|nr:hypothetical protein [Acidobacteriota bacterium]